jgi:hypothetical protein
MQAFHALWWSIQTPFLCRWLVHEKFTSTCMLCHVLACSGFEAYLCTSYLAASGAQAINKSGVAQTVHVLVTTYGESAEMARECIIRLLAAPEPLDMEKIIYLCDDGHQKAEGPRKRAVIEELRALGVHSLHLRNKPLLCAPYMEAMLHARIT